MIAPRKPNYAKLPETLRGGMQRWIEDGIKPGSFLLAMLQNELRLAFDRADPENQLRIFPILSWLYAEAPFRSWGSPKRVEDWADMHERERRESVS